MENESLLKMEHFFEVDVRMKKEMYHSAPPNEYLDESSIQKYTDKLEDSLSYIFCELKCIAKDIFGMQSSVYEKIEEMEKTTKERFYNCGFDIHKLRSFYKNNISNMEPTFVDAVKENCVGYKNNISLPIDKISSINEILHLLHSYIVNNENILQSIPLVKEKENQYGCPISLRGNTNPLFEKLLNNFPTDMDIDCTDMVAINDKKLLMMVRDKGHALTIEISLNHDIARLEYFIPKLCNIDMINNLPGVNKVNEDSVGATGVIETTIDQLEEVLFDFIEKVPTDSDIVFKTR